MSIKAMQYALEVLENFVEDPRCETHRITAINFLRQAIEQAEKQEPVAFLRKGFAKWQPLYTASIECDDDIYDIWKEKKQ